jgi:hypothetical protein
LHFSHFWSPVPTFFFFLLQDLHIYIFMSVTKITNSRMQVLWTSGYDAKNMYQYTRHWKLTSVYRIWKWIPLSGPTDATCDSFYFLSIGTQLYMFRASSAHHQESLTVHTASSFWN